MPNTETTTGQPTTGQPTTGQTSTAPPALSKRNFALVFGISLVIQIGNTGLISVIPPIGRSIGLADEMSVSIFSLSSLLFAIMSTRWAKACDRYGQKPLMLLGLGGYLVSMTLCALVVSVGLRHLFAPTAIFIAFLLARALFGLVGSAANPASQSYVADRTKAEERTQAMASLAGAVGLGQVTGPFLAPLFILPVVGLAGPLFGFAAICAVMFAAVWILLPSDGRGVAYAPDPDEPPGPEGSMWRDKRVAPFLLYGSVVVACQIGQQQTLGFLVLDKLKVSPLQAQHALAVAMMFGAVAGLLAQWGLIRMFSMTPRQLLRWGVVVAGAGNLIVAASPDYFWLVAGYALASLGFGMARPGFTAGSSLAVGSRDQAKVAGAIAAVTGISALFAPGFMWLYTHLHAGPFVLNVTLMLILLVYTFTSRQLREAAPQRATRDDSTLATLERGDEGST